MKLKLDASGNVVLQDGKPVYTKADGTEFAFDAVQASEKIATLSNEAKASRQRYETAEAAFKPFEGMDIAAVTKALTTVKNLDDKKLVDAGEMEALKLRLTTQLTEEVGKHKKAHEDAVLELTNERIGGAFARSKFIGEKLLLPTDVAHTFFGKSFKSENGKVVGYDAAGNRILSLTKMGETADFDEAMEIIVNAYPGKASILRSTQKSGSGANPAGGDAAGAKTMFRSDFDKLGAIEKREHLKGGGTVVDAAA